MASSTSSGWPAISTRRRGARARRGRGDRRSLPAPRAGAGRAPPAEKAALEGDLFAGNEFAGIVTQDPGLRDGAPDRGAGGAHGAGAGARSLARPAPGRSSSRSLSTSTARAATSPSSRCTARRSPSRSWNPELFGHAYGAPSPAPSRDRTGRIASARTAATLFLDEIAEVPMDDPGQAPPLSCRSGEIQRVGSDHTEKVTVRVVSATHRDMAALDAGGVASGRILYYRLNVVELLLPPSASAAGPGRTSATLLLDHFLKASLAARRGEAPALVARRGGARSPRTTTRATSGSSPTSSSAAACWPGRRCSTSTSSRPRSPSSAPRPRPRRPATPGASLLEELELARVAPSPRSRTRSSAA